MWNNQNSLSKHSLFTVSILRHETLVELTRPLKYSLLSIRRSRHFRSLKTRSYDPVLRSSFSRNRLIRLKLIESQIKIQDSLLRSRTNWFFPKTVSITKQNCVGKSAEVSEILIGVQNRKIKKTNLLLGNFEHLIFWVYFIPEKAQNKTQKRK